MKLFIMYNGYLKTDKNCVVGVSVIGTRSNPIVTNELVKLPVMAFLIETDDGYILYDTGVNSKCMDEGYWPIGIQEVYPMFQEEEERLENQLKLCGVKPEDIKTVVLSHLHMDHAGNMDMFPNAQVYVPKADYIAAQLAVHMNPDVSTHGAYIKSEVTAPAAQYHMVEEEFELIPGVEVINLPGHVPGLLGLVVHLDGGTVILPQDCIYTGEIYGPPAKASGLLYDSINFFKSIEKVRALEKKYNAKVIFAHDYDFFKTLKLAPGYYE